jgi:hypothetical protein
VLKQKKQHTPQLFSLPTHEKRRDSTPASARVSTERDPHASPQGLCARYTSNALQREKAATQAGICRRGREKAVLRRAGACSAGDDLALGGNRRESDLGQQELDSQQPANKRLRAYVLDGDSPEFLPDLGMRRRTSSRRYHWFPSFAAKPEVELIRPLLHVTPARLQGRVGCC